MTWQKNLNALSQNTLFIKFSLYIYYFIFFQTIHALIINYVDANTQNNKKNISFHQSSYHNHEENVLLLLECGANGNTKDDHSRLAHDLTKDPEIKSLIDNHELISNKSTKAAY